MIQYLEAFFLQDCTVPHSVFHSLTVVISEKIRRNYTRFKEILSCFFSLTKKWLIEVFPALCVNCIGARRKVTRDNVTCVCMTCA